MSNEDSCTTNEEPEPIDLHVPTSSHKMWGKEHRSNDAPFLLGPLEVLAAFGGLFCRSTRLMSASKSRLVISVATAPTIAELITCFKSSNFPTSFLVVYSIYSPGIYYKVNDYIF